MTIYAGPVFDMAANQLKVVADHLEIPWMSATACCFTISSGCRISNSSSGDPARMSASRSRVRTDADARQDRQDFAPYRGHGNRCRKRTQRHEPARPLSMMGANFISSAIDKTDECKPAATLMQIKRARNPYAISLSRRFVWDAIMTPTLSDPTEWLPISVTPPAAEAGLISLMFQTRSIPTFSRPTGANGRGSARLSFDRDRGSSPPFCDHAGRERER
jgi:hypothetical protein